MLRQGISRLVCLLACLLSPAASAALLQHRGEARDPQTGRVLYLEEHLLRQQADTPLQRLVVYRCADGTAFGRKSIDYRYSRLAPAFEFEDVRAGYREGLRHTSGPELWFAGRSKEGRSLITTPGLVADAGFDELVRTQWPRLLAGESLRFDFAVPTRQRTYALKLRYAGEDEVAGETAVRFRLGFDGWLGSLLPEVALFYDRDDRRLLRFDGLSNLRSDDGRRQLRTRIDFPQPPQAVTESHWQRLHEEPLQSCRTQG